MGAGAVKIGGDPGVIDAKHLVHRAGHQNLLLGQHRDAVAGGVQGVKVMRYKKDRQAQRLLQRPDQGVELGRADRVKAGGGFIQKQDLRVERQGAGQTGALSHAARKLGRGKVPCLGGQADHRDAQVGKCGAGGGVDGQFLAHRCFHILAHGQRREQRAVLEHHAPAVLDGFGIVQTCFDFGRRVGQDRCPKNGNCAAGRALQADDAAQKHRFTAARGADDTQNLAPAHVEVQVLVDRILAEPVGQVANGDDGIVHHTPQTEKKIEARASTTMTRKIATTTEREVRLPSESVFPATCRP
jgi:hypothetical protein